MKISVAICTYNGAKYVLEQLKSIENQIRIVDEIVVCDDISTDNTWHILCDFKKQTDIPTTLIKNEKQLGVMYNFQKAIENCTGDIILLSDQDDIWYPNKSLVFEDYFAQNQDINFCFSNAELLLDGYSENEIKEKTLFELLSFREKTQKICRDGFGLEVSQVLGRISGFTVGIRAEFRKKVLPFMPEYEYFIHDRQMALYAIEEESIDFIPECLTKYRIHSEQTSNIYEYLRKNQLLPKKEEEIFLPPIGNDVIDYLEKRGFQSERFDFSKKRTQMIKSLVGGILILLKTKEYKKFYKQYSKIVLLQDLKSHFTVLVKKTYRKVTFNSTGK